MNFLKNYLVLDLKKTQNISIVPLIFLFIVVFMICGIYETGGAEALILLWSIFSAPHFMPKEVGAVVLEKLFSMSEFWAIIFLIYSYMAFLIFLWAALCFQAISEERKREVSEIKGRATAWDAWLLKHGEAFTPPGERRVPIPVSSVLHAIGELKFKNLLIVLFAWTFMYVFSCCLINSVFIFLGAILKPLKEWIIISGSLIASGLFISLAYGMYPTRTLHEEMMDAV